MCPGRKKYGQILRNLKGPMSLERGALGEGRGEDIGTKQKNARTKRMWGTGGQGGKKKDTWGRGPVPNQIHMKFS